MPSRRISVYVVDLGTTAKPRPFQYFQWVDPDTGKRRTKSSKCKTRRAAERAAAEFEDSLNAIDAPDDGSIAWTTFRDKLSHQVLTGVAAKTAEKVEGVLNVIEQYRLPVALRDVTARFLSGYVGWLREHDRSEDTIKSHLRHLKAILNWAVENQYLPTAPKIPAITRSSKRKMMKGRPLTEAEFAKYLQHVSSVVGEAHATDWVQMARGLWLSSLRLDEAMLLSWDETTPFHVLMTDRPKLRIPAWVEKGHEDRLYPVTPDFAEFLHATPEAQRTGFVFTPTFQKGTHVIRYQNSRDVGRVFSAIGLAAKIIVDAGRSKRGLSPVPKYASAHDFRRSFGERWSKLVTPAVLQQLMRHATIQTTMMYYVGADADRTQDEVYAAWQKRKDRDER